MVVQAAIALSAFVALLVVIFWNGKDHGGRTKGNLRILALAFNTLVLIWGATFFYVIGKLL